MNRTPVFYSDRSPSPHPWRRIAAALVVFVAVGGLVGCLDGSSGGQRRDAGEYLDGQDTYLPDADRQDTDQGEPACECPSRFERCVDGECQQIELITVDFEYEEDHQSPGSGPNADVCPKRPVHEEPPGQELLLRDDNCGAYSISADWAPAYETYGMEMGTVTLAVNDDEPVELPKVESTPEFLKGCYSEYPAPDYGPGDTLRLDISGAEDFPEVTLQSVVPEPPVPTAGAPVPGEPWDVQWEAGSSSTEIVLYLRAADHGDTGRFIGCDVADDGTFTMPADFTDLLPESTDGYLLNITRRDRFELDLEGVSMPVSVETRSATENVPLAVE